MRIVCSFLTSDHKVVDFTISSNHCKDNFTIDIENNTRIFDLNRAV